MNKTLGPKALIVIEIPHACELEELCILAGFVRSSTETTYLSFIVYIRKTPGPSQGSM